MLRSIWNAIVDRPPVTEGWQLLVMLAIGVAIVGFVHRLVRQRVAITMRKHAAAEADAMAEGSRPDNGRLSG